MFGFYFAIAFMVSLFKTKNSVVAFLSLLAILIQFVGYGTGFLKATLLLVVTKKPAEQVLPKMFFQ